MAFLAPESQAPLARNERETLAPRKRAFPPTLQSTFYAGVAFLAPDRKRRSRATKGRHLPLKSGRSCQHYKVLFMREWRSLRLTASVARARTTLAPQKWAFPPTLQSTLYARVAFLAPDRKRRSRADERETLAPQKWAFPPTLQSTLYARVAFLAPEPQASLARNGRHLPLESGRSRQHCKVLFMREWRSLRLNRKRRSRATN